MVREVDTLPAALVAREAIAVMSAGVHRIYPVVDARNRPVGLVSRADALVWAVEGGQGDEPLGELVSDAALAVLHPDDVATHAVEVMLASGQGRVPVVDPATGVLQGLVTRKDLLKIRAAASREENERAVFFRRGQPSGR
jgi:CBS domain-containing protein